MRGTASTIAVCAALGSAGTAVAAVCPPDKQGDRPQDPTSTTQTTGSSASSSVREYEGTVTSVNRSKRRFRLREEDGGAVTIKVSKSTDYGDGVSGFGSLKRGDEDVEVTARKTRRGLVATEVGCPQREEGDESGEEQGNEPEGQGPAGPGSRRQGPPAGS